MNQRTVLISGAGIAGPTLAYWLARHGFHPTVVERADGLRSSGSPVDVRGPAVQVAEGMGVMARLREAGTRVANLDFVDGRGRRVGRINMNALRRAAGSREVELPRGDLAAILHQAGRDDAEFVFSDSIVAMTQDTGAVHVTFDRSAPRSFDLVIGADGLHSATRLLAFGPESDYVHHMGLYVATVTLDDPVEHVHDVLMYNTPGRAVSVHPGRDRPLAAFMFRGPAIAGFHHRDTGQHKRLLIEAFAGDAWRVPELLEQVRAAPDLYFDAVSQVRLPRWSHGRVALLGDAASCVSLFGDGSSLAMAGAATLAGALAAHPDDHRAAFRRYESEHRALVEPKQGNAGQAATMLVPATARGITARNLATRLWPLAAAGQWLGRRSRGSHTPVSQAAAL
ncbi:FAD-dependent monooxygenase [Longispora fulva]|uniref:2-polyprenyl-6-methoxyphenol hydroxylase-like FAD-dependent oxidoreductase n=1 Tax=Longispora fulva TaxID=619741 RepID=A0A8J7GRL5_9ACTN|nr:FAD-dependent monooxygenase [Longispora fulva]MBG6135691.1 2-polyprenyl-6-methoxyphenol hydroxylase-like FAD-dependent oxidoreductase [Longispora fulva]